MKSIVGLILAAGYLLLVVVLLIAWVLVVDNFQIWQNVGDALFVLALPWSIVSVFTIWIDKPVLTDIAFLAVHAIGGMINAAILYIIWSVISYVIRRLTRPRPH